MLVIFSGLPATGKTTVAHALARRLGAAHLRIDTVEQAVVDAGLAQHPVGVIGYTVCHRIARDQLLVGLPVIADSVNPLGVSRAGWHGVAESAGCPFLDVEIVCSDVDVHRKRAAERNTGIPGLAGPDWTQIEEREYEPWDASVLSLDTAVLPVEECVERIVAAVTISGAASGR